MKNEVTNEQLLTAIGKTHVKIEQMDVSIEHLQEAMNAGFARVDEKFARVDEQFAHVQKQFDHVEEQFEDLALMTKVQFDKVDRKLSILGARTRGFSLWS